MKINRAYISAVLFSTFIGLSFLFTKISLEYADTLLILAHRFAIGFIGFMLYRVYKGHSILVSKKELLGVLPVVIFYPVLFFFFQGMGLMSLSSSEAGMIHATVPILTLVLASIFLKEKTTVFQKVSVFLSVSGVIYIFMMKGTSLEGVNQMGVLFALLSAVASAVYSLLARRRLRDYSYINLTYIILMVGFLAFHVAFFVSKASQVTLNLYLEPFTHTPYVLSILYLGIFSSVLSSLFSNHALSLLPAAKISVFNNFATLVSIAAGFIFLREPLYTYHFMGAMLIIVGVIGTNIGKKKDVKA